MGDEYSAQSIDAVFINTVINDEEAHKYIQDTVRACSPTSQETIEHFNYMRVGVGVSFLLVESAMCASSTGPVQIYI